MNLGELQHILARQSRLVRFWERVDKRGPDDCWPWMGFRTSTGYGRTSLLHRTYQAHRVSWALAFGPVPDGLHVLHRCDNPPCVNPAHLFVGTHEDNMRDREKKGRCVHPRGEQHGCAKLTAANVIEIRASSESQTALAARFGVTQAAINYVILRRSWAHIP